MEKLRLSNRTLCHRVAALELQLKQLKLNPNLYLTENSNESSPWTNEIESQLRSELEEAKSQLEAVTVDLKKVTKAHRLLEKSFTNLQHSHTQLEGIITNMSQTLSALEKQVQAKAELKEIVIQLGQSLSDLKKSHVHLEKANVDLQRDLSLVQEKQTGVFLSLACDYGGRDDKGSIKWNYEKVPLNGKYFSRNKENTEITIKEKGTYRFDVSVCTDGRSDSKWVTLNINGSSNDDSIISSPNYSQCDFRTIRRPDQPNAKVKVKCNFNPDSGGTRNIFLIQRVD